METKLINNSQVQRALKVKGAFGSVLASAAMSVAGINRVNEIYSHIYQYEGVEFAEKLIEYLNIECDIDEQELENIPKEGPFIITSNHPFGAIDGIILLKTIGKIRPDFKILTNFLLSYIPNLEKSFFPVNPFTDTPGLRSSLKGLKMATEHLHNGGGLGLFPAGEVSSNCNPEKTIKDIEWQPSVIKMIRNANVPVVPVFFSGSNSPIFHLLGKIHPRLRTVRLPHELTNKRNYKLSMKIGKPIPASEQQEFETIPQLGKYLRNRTYALEANIENKNPQQKQSDTIYTTQVNAPVESSILAKEIQSIESDKLFEVNSYVCYLSEHKNIPNLIREIGVRREIAFRAVGEGTNTPIDLDNYDTYYKHLILWDKEKSAVIGAYRLGFGMDIIKEYGIKGFYSHSLFRYSQKFEDELSHSIELGRSFVAIEYQKDPLALMLLFKGLFYTVIKYPQIRHLIGPVSISSSYPEFYQSIMVHYLKEYHAIPEFADMVNPKVPFKPNFGNVEPHELLGNKTSALEKFDRFMFRHSNNKYRIPTLLKKYLKLNARIIGYNVDPDFNYCIDGLILLSLNKMPQAEIDALSKEFEDKSAIYRRFGLEKSE
jgi:putative hemolysin